MGLAKKIKPPIHNPFKRRVLIPGGRSVQVLFAAAYDGKNDHQLSYSEVQKLAKGPLAAVQHELSKELDHRVIIDERDWI